MRSKWWVSLSVLVLAVFLATSAFAITWPRYWKAKFTDWEYFNPNIQPGYQGPDNDNDGLPEGDGTEDNWGIAKVTSIWNTVPLSDIQVWSDEPDDNKSLRVFFYGLDLAYWDSNTGDYGMTALSSGAYLEIYEWDAEWNDSIINAGNRSGSTFTGITNGGTLLAKFEFTYGVTSDQDIVASGTTTTINNPPVGTGQAFLKIVDGLYKDVWNINREELLKSAHFADKDFDPTQVDPDADLYIQFNFEPLPSSDTTGFHLSSEDPAIGATIPEPASLMLVGTGLLAIGMLVRRKKMF